MMKLNRAGGYMMVGMKWTDSLRQRSKRRLSRGWMYLLSERHSKR